MRCEKKKFFFEHVVAVGLLLSFLRAFFFFLSSIMSNARSYIHVQATREKFRKKVTAYYASFSA